MSTRCDAGLAKNEVFARKLLKNGLAHHVHFPHAFRTGTNFSGGKKMKQSLVKFYAKYQVLVSEDGQDLIEYALVVAVIAFAAIAGMNSVATNINNAFTNIGTKIVSYTN
jgi:pilus assembly protein Flp/PilA